MTNTTEMIQDFNSFKALIDTDVAEHSQLLLERWQRSYDLETAQIFDAYLSILARGGKRMRGVLGMWAYYRAGGNDQVLALRVGRILEMVHAYLLVVDDIVDEATKRRGGDSAHKVIEKYHIDQKWTGNSEHFGSSQAMNAGLAAQHMIMQEITELPATDSVKLEALRELSRVLVQTVAGQIADINNQAIQNVSQNEVIDMMTHKTAIYSFVSPLQFGVILAGGDWSECTALEKWALNIGLSFQITDDILGIFGDNAVTGKSNLDDLREGKASLLIVRALAHCDDQQKQQLLSILGNHEVSPSQLEVAQAIIKDTGALEFAETLSQNYSSTAIESLIEQKNVAFLEELSRIITRRQS